MKRYKVDVREVHIRSYVVMADSSEQATEKVLNRDSGVEDLEGGILEFSHELDPSEWDVDVYEIADKMAINVLSKTSTRGI